MSLEGSTSTSSSLFSAGSGFWFETALLSGLRAAFFFACRHYVNRSLFSNLRSVIREDGGLDPALEDREAIALDEAELGAFLPSSSNGTAGSSSYDFAGSTSPRRGNSKRIDPSSGASSGDNTGEDRRSPGRSQGHVYSKLSSGLFCLSFSEASMLFTLLLFGEIVGDRVRSFNWSFSLLTLLSLIIFIVPLGLCVLLTHRTSKSLTPRSLMITMIPFLGYLFVFYKVGSLVAPNFVVEGSHSLGLVNGMLSRICVPGVVLIASLSGGGAVNTAWEAFEYRSVASTAPVTEQEIISAERSLYRARLDLQQRQRSITLATTSAAREANSSSSASSSFFSKLISSVSNPAASHLKSLKVEIDAMESVERQMVKDLDRLKKRKLQRELGKTLKGRIWKAAGWGLSVYCVWRVFISCINLIFGYQQRHHHVDDPSADPTKAKPGGTDLITSLLTKAALVLNIDLDIPTLSRLVGLVLVGSIIMANMRNVLGSVSRIFKATSTGISASFMLLFLAQLMSIYLLTSLISLPSTSSTNPTSTTLLDTLPSFSVFSKLFDSVFLISALVMFVGRWAERRIRTDIDGVHS